MVRTLTIVALMIAAIVLTAGCGSSNAPAQQVTAARTIQQELRNLAIHPIHPLPGATSAEWQTYDDAMQSYCRLQPQGQGCP